MKKPGAKIRILFSICLMFAGSLLSAASVLGKVAVTEKPAGEAGMVFVAGSPDLYPLEYYDKKDKCYKGAMPLLLEEISGETGIDFVYVSAGEDDERVRLAENNQVEVISGCMLEKELPDRAAAGAFLFPITIDGEIFQVGFGYTELATEELRNKMEGYLSKKDPRELMELLVSAAKQGKDSSMNLWIMAVLAFELFLVLAMIVAFWLLRKKRREKMELDRLVDPVTGVGNKEYFFHQFSSFISDSTRSLYYIVYMCFDIGRVNSYYGEAEAESILRYTADILSGHVKDSDFFARVTGGGFAVACQEPGMAKMEEWIGLVLQKVNKYSDKFKKDYRPEFYAGIYKLKNDDISVESVLYAAQQGYQEALRSRQSYLFCTEMILRTARERQELCKEMQQAIFSHQFQSYLQFLMDGKTGKIMGAEVLSRWQHPRMGLLMPGKYIEDMERNDTVIELDYYMFEEVCRLLQQFREEGRGHLSLFCNFSRKTVSVLDFADKIRNIARRYCFDYHKLCMEITERSMFDNDKISIKNIQKCKQMGFRIALDDVGSGYTSFRDMAHYPIDLVKIDRELLLTASQDRGRLLLQGMNALFHSIRIQTLCEGIETQGQYDMIRQIGIDYIQGFYIQRALPVKEAIRWLKEKED